MSWLAGLAFFGRVALAAAFPQPVGYVNDFADIISSPVEAELETKLENFKASTGDELAVVTLKSLNGDTVENTAVDLFKQWGIGQKDKDNGVLFLVASNERKMKIEVGYGLEPVLTDSRAGRIIRDDVTPDFKNNNYDAGISKGVDSIIAVTSGNDAAPEAQTPASDAPGVLIIAIIMITIYGLAFFWRSRKFWPGGVAGFLLGLILGLGGLAVLIALYGFFLDWLLSRNYKFRKAKKLPTSWWSSMGGFSSGHSSGGFGGFSGGSSGGGGASGGW